jgi:hypothetical protein
MLTKSSRVEFALCIESKEIRGISENFGPSTSMSSSFFAFDGRSVYICTSPAFQNKPSKPT